MKTQLNLEEIGEKIAEHREHVPRNGVGGEWCCEVSSGELTEQLFAEVHRMDRAHRKLTAEEIALVAYQVNAAHCDATGGLKPLPWDVVRDGLTMAVLEQLVTPATPRESHERWMLAKQRDGWVYGPVKDADKKTHPCMLPYDELPIGERVKDYLFGAVVDAARGIADD